MRTAAHLKGSRGLALRWRYICAPLSQVHSLRVSLDPTTSSPGSGESRVPPLSGAIFSAARRSTVELNRPVARIGSEFCRRANPVPLAHEEAPRREVHFLAVLRPRSVDCHLRGFFYSGVQAEDVDRVKPVIRPARLPVTQAHRPSPPLPRHVAETRPDLSRPGTSAGRLGISRKPACAGGGHLRPERRTRTPRRPSR